MNIICIIPQLSQPRCIKRINTLVESGHNVLVYGFDNGLYSDNISNYLCPVYRQNIETNGNRLKGFLDRVKLIKKICTQLKDGDIVYLFGIELCFSYYIQRHNNYYIYEQADLNYTKLSFGFAVRLFRMIDSFLINKSLITILTSQGFIDYLYPKGNKSKKIILIENKLSHNLKNLIVPNPVININKLRFGFVGAIRYPRTIFTFAKVIGQFFPQHEFHFYGEGKSSTEAILLCNQYKNLFYHGKFQNPYDLPFIYEHIDLNIVCYDTSSKNVQIAEPNKLYESAYFLKPLVVSKGTFLEKKVLDWGIGFSCDASNIDDVVEFVNSLSNDKIIQCVEKCKSIPNEDLFDNPIQYNNIINERLSE